MSNAPRAARPEVSVVIPTRNRRNSVLGAIESALRQEDVAVEVVVVDDGSTDGTEAAVSAVKGVRVIRHPVSLGVAAARNAGISAAAADWIALLDDDDLWAPWKLRRQLAAARDGGAPWAYGAAIVIDEQDRIVAVHEAPSPDLMAEHLTRYNAVPAGASNVIVRRELLRVTEGFDTALHHFADWDLWIRLTAAHLPARSVERLVAYVRHPDNMQVRQISSARREFDYMSNKVAATTGRRLDGSLLPHWLADGYSRAGRRWRAATILASAAIRQQSWEYARATAGELARCVGFRRGDTGQYTLAPAWAGGSAGDDMSLRDVAVPAEGRRY